MRGQPTGASPSSSDGRFNTQSGRTASATSASAYSRQTAQWISVSGRDVKPPVRHAPGRGSPHRVSASSETSGLSACRSEMKSMPASSTSAKRSRSGIAQLHSQDLYDPGPARAADLHELANAVTEKRLSHGAVLRDAPMGGVRLTGRDDRPCVPHVAVPDRHRGPDPDHVLTDHRHVPPTLDKPTL